MLKFNKLNPILLSKDQKILAVILLFFGVIFCLLSLINHANLRTSALDLGLYTNALYDYRNFQFNDSLLFKPQAENLFADHFDFYLPVFSFLSFLFGTYTLLIIQIVALLFGAIGIYKFVEFKYKDSPLAHLMTICFLSFYGLYSALSFDYHSSVVASMFIPWLFYFMEKKNRKKTFIVLFLILIGKENMGLWLFFIGAGMVVLYWKDKFQRNTAFIISGISLLYLYLVLGVIMPRLSTKHEYQHLRYAILGRGLFDTIGMLLEHPLGYFKYLFINHDGNPYFDNIKKELWVALSFSGLVFLVFRPIFLFMLIPIFLQKLYHDSPIIWGVYQQYSIEFAPILIIGLSGLLVKIKANKWRYFSALLLIYFTGKTTFGLMEKTEFDWSKEHIRVFEKEHYSTPWNEDEIYQEINKIPQNANVSCNSALAPHLALRDNLYSFPVVKNADYIIVSPITGTYPLNPVSFDSVVTVYKNKPDWKCIHNSKQVTVLKKISK